MKKSIRTLIGTTLALSLLLTGCGGSWSVAEDGSLTVTGLGQDTTGEAVEETLEEEILQHKRWQKLILSLIKMILVMKQKKVVQLYL